MIKLGIKNYFKSYRLFFLPIGALSLGLIAGFSVFLPALFGAIKDFFRGAMEILGDVKPNWQAVWETVLATFQGVDYSDLEAAARYIFNKEFFAALFNDCLHAAIDVDALIAQFQELLSACAVKAIKGGVALIALTVLGVFVGIFSTRVEIRRDVAKRSFRKFILVSLLHTVINLTIIAAGVWLISTVRRIWVLSALLTIFLYGFVSFFEAYMVHGYKKVPLKKVIRVRNFFSLFLLSVIEVAIMALLIYLSFALTNVVIGFFLSYAVTVITFSCLSLNAEAYVKDMAASYEAQANAVSAALPQGEEGKEGEGNPPALEGESLVPLALTEGSVGTVKGDPIAESPLPTEAEAAVSAEEKSANDVKK